MTGSKKTTRSSPKKKTNAKTIKRSVSKKNVKRTKQTTSSSSHKNNFGTNVKEEKISSPIQNVDIASINNQYIMDYDDRYVAAIYALPLKWRFEMLIVDPPWERISRGRRTMSLKMISDLPVRELASRNGCTLFLWTPPQYMPEALDMIAAWGFKYMTIWYIQIDPESKLSRFLLMSEYSTVKETEHVNEDKETSYNTKRNSESINEDVYKRKRLPPPQISIDAIFETAEKRIRRIMPSSSRLRLFADKDNEGGWSSWGPDVPGYYKDKPKEL